MTCTECSHPCDGSYYIDKRWPLCKWCYEKLIQRQSREQCSRAVTLNGKLYEQVPGGYRKRKLKAEE